MGPPCPVLSLKRRGDGRLPLGRPPHYRRMLSAAPTNWTSPALFLELRLRPCGFVDLAKLAVADNTSEEMREI
jgi:hypothetical protein